VSANEEDWIPQLGPRGGPEFKWGRNGETGEFTIWEVGGPGDGFPGHHDVLSPLWNRDELHRPGDLLGVVLIDDTTVKAIVFRSGNEAPAELLGWCREEYPEHMLAVG